MNVMRPGDGAARSISGEEGAMDDWAQVSMPSQLAAIEQRTAELGFDMASEPRTGALLRVLAASKPKGRFLELGTGTGIATAWLLDGMDAEAELISVDTDARVQEVAREALKGDGRLTLVTEDGLTFLKKQLTASFDFVFADAMPGKYDGLGESLRVITPGGFYVIDDLLPQANWPEGHAAKVAVLLEALAARADFKLVSVAWSSGMLLAVKQTERNKPSS